MNADAQRIGELLGTSGQAAQQRYGAVVEADAVPLHADARALARGEADGIAVWKVVERREPSSSEAVGRQKRRPPAKRY